MPPNPAGANPAGPSGKVAVRCGRTPASWGSQSADTLNIDRVPSAAEGAVRPTRSGYATPGEAPSTADSSTDGRFLAASVKARAEQPGLAQAVQQPQAAHPSQFTQPLQSAARKPNPPDSPQQPQQQKQQPQPCQDGSPLVTAAAAPAAGDEPNVEQIDAQLQALRDHMEATWAEIQTARTHQEKEAKSLLFQRQKEGARQLCEQKRRLIDDRVRRMQLEQEMREVDELLDKALRLNVCEEVQRRLTETSAGQKQETADVAGGVDRAPVDAAATRQDWQAKESHLEQLRKQLAEKRHEVERMRQKKEEQRLLQELKQVDEERSTLEETEAPRPGAHSRAAPPIGHQMRPDPSRISAHSAGTVDRATPDSPGHAAAVAADPQPLFAPGAHRRPAALRSVEAEGEEESPIASDRSSDATPRARGATGASSNTSEELLLIEDVEVCAGQRGFTADEWFARDPSESRFSSADPRLAPDDAALAPAAAAEGEAARLAELAARDPAAARAEGVVSAVMEDLMQDTDIEVTIQAMQDGTPLACCGEPMLQHPTPIPPAPSLITEILIEDGGSGIAGAGAPFVPQGAAAPAGGGQRREDRCGAMAPLVAPIGRDLDVVTTQGRRHRGLRRTDAARTPSCTPRGRPPTSSLATSWTRCWSRCARRSPIEGAPCPRLAARWGSRPTRGTRATTATRPWGRRTGPHPQ
ncbi:unnamed protein product [Prorocentrum cordatum]|uniref:Uncharacterized protein n=1 Tax=Prorocentrum cordatum TaxID=2364126 RepID=A0ABN9RPG5_9DINO|nr:unnamed protein product [Polarella glacialis]